MMKQRVLRLAVVARGFELNVHWQNLTSLVCPQIWSTSEKGIMWIEGQSRTRVKEKEGKKTKAKKEHRVFGRGHYVSDKLFANKKEHRRVQQS